VSWRQFLVVITRSERTRAMRLVVPMILALAALGWGGRNMGALGRND